MCLPIAYSWVYINEDIIIAMYLCAFNNYNILIMSDYSSWLCRKHK